MTSKTDDYRSCSAFRAKALCVSCGLSNIGAFTMRQTCEARPPRFELGAPSIRRRGGILSTGALYLLEPVDRFFRGLWLVRMSSPALLGQPSHWSKFRALAVGRGGAHLLYGRQLRRERITLSAPVVPIVAPDCAPVFHKLQGATA